MKGVAQAEVVRDTRASAGASYALESEAIGQAYAETSMQDAVALQQYQWRSLQARASVQARATAGKSIDRIVIAKNHKLMAIRVLRPGLGQTMK